LENLRTFAEISRTVIENIIPRGSIIRVKIIGVWNIDINSHSMRVVFHNITVRRVGIIIKVNIAQINLFE